MEKELEVLSTARDYILNLEGGINSIVEKIQKEEFVEVNKLLILIIDGLQWLSDAVRVSESLHNGKISFENLNSILLEVVDGLENSDYILVGDILNYDVLEELNKIKNGIDNIID